MATTFLDTRTLGVYIQYISLQTNIVNGKLLTSAYIVLSSVKKDNIDNHNFNIMEEWEEKRFFVPFHQMPSAQLKISDVLNLDSDISSLNPQMQELYIKLVTFIASVNQVRQLL